MLSFLASGNAVNATQEMLTLGLCNILASFFSAMPSTGAFTRSAVISASGVRTPMAGIYVGNMYSHFEQNKYPVDFDQLF